MSTNQDPFDESEPGSEYGWTVGLTRNGDLRRNALHQYAIIYDERAVIQDLKVAMLTPQGFDPLRPEYGLDVFRAFGTNNAELRMAIHDCIGPHAAGIERVEQVDEIEIERIEGDRENVDINITVSLVDSGTQNFDFALRRRQYAGFL